MKSLSTLSGRFFLFCFFSVLSFPAFAQKEYNTWYFGDRAGLSFNTTPPSPLTGSKMYSLEAGSGISDKNGNLLFYTNGDTIYNRNHQPMLNSATSAYNLHMSSAQGAMVVPVPGSNHLYYLFVCPASEYYANDKFLRYWTIDMLGDAGLGAVTGKEKPLLTNAVEGFGLTMHANGKDYWIATSDIETGEFECTRTVNGSLTAPVQRQSLGLSKITVSSNNKFSPNSKIYTSHFDAAGNLNICHFDNATGKISGRIALAVQARDVEFSPDSRFIYAMNYASGTRELVQYDLCVWDSAAIAASKYVLASGTDASYFLGLQLGPDQKIYGFKLSSSIISVINTPNGKAAACNFNLNGLDISPAKNVGSAPYYPTSLFRNDTISLGNDTVICSGDSLKLQVKGATGSILWSTGETTASVTVKKTGIYSVAVSVCSGVLRDTVKVTVADKFKVYLGNDTAFCHQFAHLLKAGAGAKSYKWSTGSTLSEVTVTQQGLYSVKVLDSNTCPAGDTIRIDEIKKPVITDTADCERAVLAVLNRQPGVSYSWNTGDTGTSISVKQKGQYIVTAAHKFCSNKDTIQVNLLPGPLAGLGPDTFYCGSPVQLKTTQPGTYLWNTGAVTPSIVATKPGTYILRITQGLCSAFDTIVVRDCANEMNWYIPNVFSPDGNEHNPVFRVYGDNIGDVRMQIYSRWGEKLYDGSGTDVSWDGIYMGQPCEQGVYLYVVDLKGYQRGTAAIKHLGGTLTLFR